MNKKKNSKPDEYEEALANELEKNPNLGKIIEAMLPYGIGTVKTIMQVTNLSQKIVRSGFAKLARLHLVYQWASARIEIAREGRPEKPFVFTSYGADRLHAAGFPSAQALDLDGPLDVAHRLCMALAGCHADLVPEIEKVFPYGDGKNMRIDLVTSLDGTSIKRLVEIEQKLDSSHKERAVAKLRGLGELFPAYPQSFDEEVLFIFNLIDEDLQATIKVWRQALKEVGWLPYTVRYCTLRKFLELPYFDSIEDFPILIPSETRSRLAPKEKETFDQVELPLNAIIELPSKLEEISKRHPKRVFDKREKQRYISFLAILLEIYEADFGSQGATSVYGLYPATSLARLREFLHLEINRPLLFRLRKAIADIHKRQLGLTLYQDAISKFIWNIFLLWFGLGRSGPLTVFIEVPEVGGKVSEIRFDALLHLPNELGINVPPLSTEAINWVLSAFLIYPEQLGLIDPKA
jgi:hypothetical protein